MTSQPVPMINPDVVDLPPPRLRRRVGSNEQLVWWSWGRSGRCLYGLTGRRLLYSGLLDLSLGRDGGSGGAIYMLRVTGGPERGDIQLQSRFIRPSAWATSGLVLKGVDRPLDVAQLIKSTPGLDGVQIEDRTH